MSLAIDESRIESVQSGAEQGAGVRVLSGGTTHFAHVDGLDPADLERAASEAAAALRGERAEPRPLRAVATSPEPVEQPPEEVCAERKAALLRELDERGRAEGAEVAQLRASYAEARRRVAVANSDGLLTGDDRTRTRIGVQAIARRGERVETGAETLGGSRGFELLEDDPAEIAASAAGKALALLEAGAAPAGSMPVVVGGGFGGVLFHEMTGHGLEADHVQKGASVYAGKLGERVAQPLLTAYDDGRLPGEWGSDAIDDEGTPTQKTRVIEEGRLVSFLYDRLRAERDGVASTGNGRRESFRHLPIPRMTNTYIAPGEAEPEAIVAEVDKGFYAASFAGGQVDPASGDFVFGVSEGYLIEGGKVTRPCRGATLIGNCLDALAAIDAVGSNFWMKTGICGKSGQQAPVGTGQGHVRIAALTVGGTKV
jgi:TldD protein